MGSAAFVARMHMRLVWVSGRQPSPPFGMSERELSQIQQAVETALPEAKAALARGDISFVKDELEELFEVFRFEVDVTSAAYRALGSAVLKRHV